MPRRIRPRGVREPRLSSYVTTCSFPASAVAAGGYTSSGSCILYRFLIAAVSQPVCLRAFTAHASQEFQLSLRRSMYEETTLTVSYAFALSHAFVMTCAASAPMDAYICSNDKGRCGARFIPTSNVKQVEDSRRRRPPQSSDLLDAGYDKRRRAVACLEVKTRKVWTKYLYLLAVDLVSDTGWTAQNALKAQCAARHNATDASAPAPRAAGGHRCLDRSFYCALSAFYARAVHVVHKVVSCIPQKRFINTHTVQQMSVKRFQAAKPQKNDA
eukprot:1401744-Pleurochrysis_carterae.AAC.2